MLSKIRLRGMTGDPEARSYAPDGFRYELRAELARIFEAAEPAESAVAE